MARIRSARITGEASPSPLAAPRHFPPVLAKHSHSPLAPLAGGAPTGAALLSSTTKKSGLQEFWPSKIRQRFPRRQSMGMTHSAFRAPPAAGTLSMPSEDLRPAVAP